VRIYLSTKGSKRPHVVFECTRREAAQVHDTMVKQVGRPVQVAKTDNGYRYRFAETKLWKLANTFPHADQSDGVSKRVHREVKVPLPDDFTVPGFVGELSDDQKVGAYLASQRRKFLIMDDMRMGKTRQALCAAAVHGEWPVLVVTPNNVKQVWERHIHENFPGLTCAVIGGTAKQREKQLTETPDIVIAHYEAIRIHTEFIRQGDEVVARGPFVERDWKMIILDEFQHIKGPTAQQTLAVHSLCAPRKVLLSGTPVLNGRLEELWGPLHFAWPTKFPSYWMFQKDYLIIKHGTVAGYKNVDRLREFMLARSIRRLNPAKLAYSVLEVELTPEQRKLYEEIRDEFQLWLEDGTKKTIQSILVRATRLKQAAFSPELYGGSPHSAKVNAVRQLVGELVDQGNKVIVLSQWSRATNIIRRELGEYADAMAYVTGDIPYKRREVERERFQVDPACMVYVGTIRANQEGIALHAASHVIFTDLDWVPAVNEQAAARALTWTPKEKDVRVIELRGKDTVEERIVKVLEHKRSMNAAFIERGGGKRKIRRQIARHIRELL
jgi:SNF2 family DNA or RNA helicase